MIRAIAVHMTHQKKMYELVNAPSAVVPIGRKPVFDRLDRCDDLGGHTGLFPNFPQRGLLESLSLVDDALRKLPSLLRHDLDDDDFRVCAASAINDPAGRDL